MNTNESDEGYNLNDMWSNFERIHRNATIREANENYHRAADAAAKENNRQQTTRVNWNMTEQPAAMKLKFFVILFLDQPHELFMYMVIHRSSFFPSFCVLFSSFYLSN